MRRAYADISRRAQKPRFSGMQAEKIAGKELWWCVEEVARVMPPDPEVNPVDLADQNNLSILTTTDRAEVKSPNYRTPEELALITAGIKAIRELTSA